MGVVPERGGGRASQLPGSGSPAGMGVQKTGEESLGDVERIGMVKLADRLQSLDIIYSQVKKQLLNYQHYTSGLFPRFSNNTKEGYVRDSIYAATTCWAVGRAYEKLDDDRGRQYEMKQSAVKTMRGILTCWTQQTEQLGKFKNQTGPQNALHSKFHLATRQPIATTAEYSHLQMDIVALYLLHMAQMVCSGLQILFSEDEVCVVQNLVFYIERAYRTPDFGMWERGTRYNDGTPEIHASTLGLVKAALEAVSEVTVFGPPNSPTSTAGKLYVDVDAHNRNRTTLETLLPRESHSRNTDAALLSAVLYPAFATHQLRVRAKAVDKMLRKLMGTHGIKRFLRDGYRHEKEDPHHRFYEKHETVKFKDSECEWPLFLLYLNISHQLLGETQMAEDYWDRLHGLLEVDNNGLMVVPECFVKTSGEGSRWRSVNAELEEPPVFIWGQSLFFLARLLREGLLENGDLDPLYRHLPASQRPRPSSQRLSFQGSGNRPPVVQVGVIAESSRVQRNLATFGITSQTPHEVAPVQIWPTNRLVQVLAGLGECSSLGLSGRPKRPVGALGTSKFYRVFGETIICIPLIFDVTDFYLSADPNTLIDDIKRELRFVATRWKLSGRPTCIVYVREANLGGDSHAAFLRLLADIKAGSVEGVRVKTGRVQNLLSASSVEYLDFIQETPDDLPRALSSDDDLILSEISKSKMANLDEVVEDVCFFETDTKFSMNEHEKMPSMDLVNLLATCGPTKLRSRALILEELAHRTSMDEVVEGARIRDRIERVHREACVGRVWAVVRLTAALLQKEVSSLAPSVTAVLVRGNRITLGLPPHQKETLIAKPVAPWTIVSAIYNGIPRAEVAAGVLSQELLIGLESLLNAEPLIIREVLTVHVAGLIHALQLLFRFRQGGSEWEEKHGVEKNVPPNTGRRSSIYSLSPTEMKKLLHDLLAQRHWSKLSPCQQRQLNGATGRIPMSFYDRIWFILERSKHGLKMAGETLTQDMLNDMTRYELTFNLKLENILTHIEHPEHRQLYIELVAVVSVVLERHPELNFAKVIDLEELMNTSLRLLAADRGTKEEDTAGDLGPLYRLGSSFTAHTPTTASYFAKRLCREFFDPDVERRVSGFEAIAAALPLDHCAVS